MKIAHLLLVSTLVMASITVSGQGTDASIEISVIDEARQPVQGATIDIVNTATGFKAQGLSKKNDVYRFYQLPLGGPYRVTVSFVGFQTIVREGFTLDQGSTEKIVISLSRQESVLKEITVSAGGFKSRNERLGRSTAIKARDIQRLPSVNRDFTSLAQLSPMVGNNTNIGGINSRNDAFTVDGVTSKESAFGEANQMPYTFSLEALREFEVVTNSYDVTEGRSVAGGIKGVTKSGTNEFHGSVFSYFWDNRLAAQKDLLGRNVINDTKRQLGFSLGGPIIKDKLHFFIAYDGQRQEQAYDLWAQSVTPGVVQNNRGQLATKENLDKVISILQDKYGVPNESQYGFFTRQNQLNTYLAKVDWQISTKHKLTVRYNQSDYVQPDMANSDIGNNGISNATYNFIIKNKQALLNLRSQLSNNLSNELKLGYYFNTRQNELTTPPTPQLWMKMQSEIDGSMYDATLVGFYNRWIPEIQESDIYSVTNDVYWNKGRLNFIFGTQNTFTRTSGIYTHDIKGRFDFNSIAALEAMQPDRFTRKFTNPGQELNGPLSTGLAELAVYAQATINLTQDIKLAAGLRYDASIFSTAPDYNATLYKELGYANNVRPRDLNNIQPRLSFNWDVKGRQKDIIDAGFGLFAGQMVTRPYIYALIDNGIRFTGIDIWGKEGYIIDPATDDFLLKDGERVPMPAPNYSDFSKDQAAIPGKGYTKAELFGAGNEAQVVRFVDKDLQLPTSLKSHISYHHYFTNWLRAGVKGYLLKTFNMLTMVNANLTSNVAFTLQGEGGREVYTPIDQMKAASANFAPAKKSQQFTDALMFTNGYENRSMGIVFDVDLQLPREGSLSLSYTRAQSKGADFYRNEDDQRYVGASYFDNYSFINNGYAPNDFRQKILVNFTSPKIGGFTFGAFLNMVETGRFSALITQGTEVMGTNIRDLNGYAAFIFDPNSPSTLEYQGAQFVDDLRNVFANAGPAAHEYLMENMGKYAQPNGGLMGWRTVLNARISNELPIYKGHRIGINIDAFNVLNLINKEWGGFWNYPFQELYRITGFDANRKSYVYEVNKNYGQRRKEGNGFLLMFGVKYSF